jgi:hypothetical protein
MILSVTQKFPDRFSNRCVSGLLLFVSDVGHVMRNNDLPFKVDDASAKMKEGL